MKLNLKNPLLFFDIESTGLNVASDRIVEICAIKVLPNGEKEVKTRRLNPTIPISPEAQAVHGISDEDVKDCPTFKQIAKSLAEWMSGCDIAGYNSLKFDIPLLSEEFLRADVDFDFRTRNLVDVQNIFHKLEQRTLVAAYKFYCGKNLEDAHSAEADTLATYEVLEAQLDRYPEQLENDVKFLAKFSTRSKLADYAGRMIYDDNGVALFNFGKHKGKPVLEVLAKEPSYYSWIINGDFTRDTKKVLTEIYLSSKKR
jgi:DNA polymerase-3 subunit epsilon